MILKEKNKLWLLTFPFAHGNYTTIGETLYFPKGKKPNSSIISHEKIHMIQQKKIGVAKFLFLYLFCLPFIYNPWRYKWEYEAYIEGSQFSEGYTKSILKSYKYGWLHAFC